jgi:hypothetical protein
MSKDIDCADLLKKALAVAGHADLAGMVQVSDAATFLKDPEKARSTLASGAPVLLSDVAAQHKETLYQHIGLRLKGRSDFLFIRSKPDSNGQPCEYVADTGDLSAIDAPEGHMAEDHGNLNPETGPGGGPEELPAESESVAPLPDIAPEQAWLQAFCDGAARIVGYSASAGNDFPPNAVYKTWFFDRLYPWRCEQRSKWKEFTPQSQNTFGTVDYKIQGFLDEMATGYFQWVYLQALGYWSVGPKGMNRNAYNEKGWAIGTVGMIVETPEDFIPVEMSPVNTNDQSQVTSSTAFQVDLSTSGGGGSYNVSNSETKTISQWAVTLHDLNKWTYQQAQKFAGKPTSFPKSEVYYSAGNVRYELYPLPSLSSNVFNFCTMSVFRNRKVKTGPLLLQPWIDCQYYYIAIKSQWPDYIGSYWTKPFNTIEWMEIDLTLFSKPKQV